MHKTIKKVKDGSDPDKEAQNLYYKMERFMERYEDEGASDSEPMDVLDETIEEVFVENGYLPEYFNADSFEAPRMRGTDFSIEGIEDWPLRTYEDERSRQEILEMIEQIRDRLEYYKLKYKEAKAAKDRSQMVLSIRNWKALEGAKQALRWALGEKGVDHPLY